MTNEPAILFAKPGAVSAPDKTKLRKIGVVVVEVESLDDVKLIYPQRTAAELPHGDILTAAANAIKRAGGLSMDYFGDEVAKAIIAQASKERGL